MELILDRLHRSKWSASLQKMAGDSFEDTFASIAHSYLQEKAIKLIPYLVGFEVVDSNDENTKAIGMFAFKVGKRFLYAPVFFLNGQIKPLELLYIKDESLFVPLSEDWVNHLLKQKPIELGTPSDDHKNKQFSSPNMEVFATPPQTGRYISAAQRDSIIPSWLDKFDINAHRALLGAMKKNAEFGRAVSRFVDVDELADAFRRKGATIEKKAETKVNKTETFVFEPGQENDDPEFFRRLTVDEKKKAKEGKTVVRDNRPEKSTSKLYDSQYPARYSNPVMSGVYKVIDGDGNITTAVVLLNPKSLSRLYASAGATVIELSTGKWTVAPVADIWVRESTILDEPESAIKGKAELTAGAIGQTYLFVNDRLRSSVPFRIAGKITERDGLLSYRLQPVELQLPTGGIGSADVMSSETACSEITPKAIISPRAEGDITSLGHGVVVPANYSLMKLNAMKGPEDRFHLGTSGDVMYHLRRHNINELLISPRQGDFAINVDGIPKSAFSKKAALHFLMDNMGVHGTRALPLLEEIDSSYLPKKVLVKLAQGYPGPTQGIQIPDPMLGPDSGAAQSSQYFGEDLIPLQSGQGQPPMPMETSESNMYSGPSPDYSQMDTGLAMEASGTGQQRVFDHAVLGTLAKTTQTSDLIQSYIPDLQTALDRLGRILFLMWSKPEDFKDLYGIAELEEGEDTLRNVFRSFGELLLTLKSKESSRMLDVAKG